MTDPVSRRRILGVAGTAAGSFAMPGILNGRVMAAPSEFCDFVWPMTGRIIEISDSSEGVKITNDTGTPVRASRAGEVTYQRRMPPTPNDRNDYHVVITHENGYETTYLPLTVPTVEEGDTVERGQLIGHSGDFTDEDLYEPPNLYFDINRNDESRPIPGDLFQRVTVGEMIPRNYAGIKCPNGEPRPGPIFNDLKEQKLALATRIDTISNGMIQEKQQVRNVLNALEAAAANGTISSSEARDSVRRLKLGEEVTERVLVGAGPATPDDGSTDYDIATETVETVLKTAVSLTFSYFPFGRLLKNLPFGRKLVTKAKSAVTRGIKWLFRGLLDSKRIARRARGKHRDIAGGLYDEAKDLEKREASYLVNRQDEFVDAASDPLTPLLLNEVLDEGLGSLEKILDRLNQFGDPTNHLSFKGTLDGATRASEQGIAGANRVFENTSGTFETFDNATSNIFVRIAELILSILSAAGLFTGGVLTFVATLGNQIIAIGKAIANLTKAGIGWRALVGLKQNHARTIEGVTTGTPVDLQ